MIDYGPQSSPTHKKKKSPPLTRSLETCVSPFSAQPQHVIVDATWQILSCELVVPTGSLAPCNHSSCPPTCQSCGVKSRAGDSIVDHV